MTFKRISFIFLFIIFLSASNIFSYTLPKESDMYNFLPDKIGNWVADNTFDMRPFLDNPSLNPGYSKARSAFRSYINGNKQISIMIVASTVISTGDESGEIECTINTKDITIQGFNGYTMETVCNDGVKVNGVLVTFIDEKNFIYNLIVSGTSSDETGIGNVSTELPSIDELYNVANTLDLKGIRALAKWYFISTCKN